jgi:hypothetical protein
MKGFLKILVQIVVIVIGICVALLLIVYLSSLKSSKLPLEQRLDKVHEEYEMRYDGAQPTFLRPGGETKAEVYRNCFERGYYRDKPFGEFCTWLAGLGTPYHLREPQEIVEYRDTPEYKSEVVCLAALSIGRDNAEEKGDRDRLIQLTRFQDKIFLRHSTRQFPSAHIDANKFLLNQEISEGEKQLGVELRKCGWRE